MLPFGDLELLPDEGLLRRKDGTEVHCTRTEFRLLCELAANPNKVLSREQLLDRVWGYDYFGDGRLVDVHIRRLRTKVEPDPALPRHILTVRGWATSWSPDDERCPVEPTAAGRRPTCPRRAGDCASVRPCGDASASGAGSP